MLRSTSECAIIIPSTQIRYAANAARCPAFRFYVDFFMQSYTPPPFPYSVSIGLNIDPVGIDPVASVFIPTTILPYAIMGTIFCNDFIFDEGNDPLIL